MTAGSKVSFPAENLQLAGQLAGNAGRLEVIDPRLGALNGLGVAAAFDLQYDRGRLRVVNSNATITAGRPVVSVEAVQAFTVNLATGDVVPSGDRQELVRISLDGVPITWIRALLPGFELGGDEVRGELVAALRGKGRVWLRTASPLSVRGLAISHGGRVVLPPCDLSLDAEVEHSAEGTDVRLARLNIAAATGDQLDARGKIAVKPDGAISIEAGFDASLPALVRASLPAGPVVARGSLALSRSGGIIQVDRMEAHLATADARPLADLSSPGGFRIDCDRRQIAPMTGASGDVLRVSYGRIPLDVREPWSDFLELKGELTGGEFTLRAEGGKLSAAGVAPLRMEKVSAMGGGVTWFKDLAVEFFRSLNLYHWLVPYRGRCFSFLSRFRTCSQMSCSR